MVVMKVGVAAPCLTTGYGAATIGCNRAVVSAHREAATNGKDVLKCISTISAHLQHAAVEAEIRVQIGGFEIEIMPEC